MHRRRPCSRDKRSGEISSNNKAKLTEDGCRQIISRFSAGAVYTLSDDVETFRKNETTVEVQSQLNKIFPPGPECLPSEEGRLLSPEFSLGQHYVIPGGKWPLRSEDARRNPQHGRKVLIAIEASLVSPNIAHPEPASTQFISDPRTSSLRERNHCRQIYLGKRVLRLSPPGHLAIRRQRKSGYCRCHTPTPTQNHSYGERPPWVS